LGKLSLHQVELDQPVQQLAQLTAEQIAEEISDEEHFSFQITKLEQQLGNMKPNLAAIAEYRKKVCLSSNQRCCNQKDRKLSAVPKLKRFGSRGIK